MRVGASTGRSSGPIKESQIAHLFMLWRLTVRLLLGLSPEVWRRAARMSRSWIA